MEGSNGNDVAPNGTDPTQRVVLSRHKVQVIPEDTPNDVIKQVQQLLGATRHSAPIAEAWVLQGIYPGATKRDAIEAHAGKPNTPDARPGTYKAVTVSAWSGGEVYTAPPKPKVERTALVD